MLPEVLQIISCVNNDMFSAGQKENMKQHVLCKDTFDDNDAEMDASI